MQLARVVTAHRQYCKMTTGSRSIWRVIASIVVILGIGSLLLSAYQYTAEETTLAGSTTGSNYDLPRMKSPPLARIILYWTSQFGSDVFNFGIGQEPFIKAGCKVTNCWATNDRGYDKFASAVLFSNRELTIAHDVLPCHRAQHQYYVFVEKENPARFNSDHNLRHFNGFFNLTSTYALDSDFPAPYGRTVKKAEKDKVNTSLLQDYTALVRGKKKLVAWMVSNCDQVTSGRMEYVKLLQKFIQVDIYGRCGTLSCPGNRETGECYDMIERDYKFYLSFENSYCMDYMTEKVFNLLNRVVVPVVYGGGNYSRDLPPNSVINIEDYESPKALAEYLKYLDGHDEVYMQYFTWKSAYEVNSDGLKLYRQGICDLCEFLNLDNPPRKVYTNIDQWWSRERHCDPHGMPDTLRQGMLKS